jgi:hypothetical protein
MNIRIGIYDFFAYTIPGGFYLANIVYFAVAFNYMSITPQLLSNISFTEGVVIIIIAYVIGLMLTPTAKLWHRVFNAKNPAHMVLKEFKEKRKYTHITFEAYDWPILLAYMRQKDTELTADIEHLNCIHFMLRGVSFSLAILGVTQLLEYFLVGPQTALIVSIICVTVLCILAGQEAKKFNKWFYAGIYEAAIASDLKPSDLFTTTKVILVDNNERPLKK